MDTGADKLERRILDHEKRIRVLEASRWKVVGAIALLTILLTGVGVGATVLGLFDP